MKPSLFDYVVFGAVGLFMIFVSFGYQGPDVTIVKGDNLQFLD